VIRRISHSLFRLLVGLSAAAIVLVAAVGARLTVGPIKLSWLAPYIERAIQPADERLRIEVGNAGIRLGDDRVVELVGVDVRAKGPGGELLVELPEIEIGVSLEALIWRGMLAATSLQATAPRLVLGRDENGRFGLRGLSAAGRPPAPRAGITLEALLDPLLKGGPDEPLSYLRRLRIAGGQLVLEDRVTNHTILARNAELSAQRLVDGLAAQLAFDLDQGGPPATVLAESGLEAATGRVTFAIGFAGLSVPELVRIDPALPLRGVDLTLAGRLAGDAARQGQAEVPPGAVQKAQGAVGGAMVVVHGGEGRALADQAVDGDRAPGVGLAQGKGDPGPRS
jgi:hypothetical protein